MALSISETESWMVIPEVALLIFRELIPVISATFTSQSVLSPDVKQMHDRGQYTQPQQSKSEAIAEVVGGRLARQEHIAEDRSVRSHFQHYLEKLTMQ